MRLGTKWSASKRRTAIEDPDGLKATAEDSGNDPVGETAVSGSEEETESSGFGGLGLEGMIGREDSMGEGVAFEPAGVGNRGVMSGESAGGSTRAGEEEGVWGNGSTAGEAEMAESFRCCWWAAAVVRNIEHTKSVCRNAWESSFEEFILGNDWEYQSMF